MKRSISELVLLILIILLSLGAFFGGIILILDPSGDLLGLPADFVNLSPFGDLLIPGIILTTLLGVFPLGVFFALIYKPNSDLLDKFRLDFTQHWSWNFSIYVGIAVIFWINFQVLVIDSFDILHFTYITWGVIIILVANLPAVREKYSTG